MIHEQMRFDVRIFQSERELILVFKRYKGKVEIKEYKRPKNTCPDG